MPRPVRLLIAFVAAALASLGLFFWLYDPPDTPPLPVYILVFLAVFAGIWGLLEWRHSRKQRSNDG